MTNFIESLSFGMQIAQKRHQNFLEIHDVMFDLKKQIESYSNGKILIELIGESGEYFTNFDKNQDMLYESKNLFASLSSAPENVYDKLTRIEFSTDGYPCTINIEGNKYDAFDKNSLEENLKNLLSTASIGEIIFKLVNYK